MQHILNIIITPLVLIYKKSLTKNHLYDEW